MARLTVITVGLFVILVANADDAPTLDELSVNDIMISVVTPATDTLWGIEDPQSDAEWQVFEDAADRVVDAFRKIKEGGTGPNDADWAADARWAAFSDQVTKSAMDAKYAVQERDLDAVFVATDEMYPPCENCHLEFHPGVKK